VLSTAYQCIYKLEIHVILQTIVLGVAMRILYCIPRYDADAVGNLMHTEVIAHWNSQGHETHVASLSSREQSTTTYHMDGIQVYHLPTASNIMDKVCNRVLGWMTGYPYLFGAWRSMRALLQREQYDILHIETSFPLGFITLLARPTQTPVAVTLPGADVMAVPAFDYGYARNWFVRQAVRWVVQRAELIRADSRQIATLVKHAYDAPDARVIDIPYNITEPTYPPAGVDITAFRAQARATICTRHGWQNDAKLILSLNRLHPFKGIEYLVEAIPLLVARGINAHAVIVGGNRSTARFGDYGAYLQQRARELGVTDRVHLIGGVPHHDVAEYMAGCDVAVIPSIAESFSRVVIEATAVSTPPVVTRTTGASDYVKEADCGEVVEPQSGTSLADGIERALARTDELQQRCPAFAAGFRAPVIADALMNAYRTHGLCQ
jgi:glycosyltransferase involved in cell wall biosynthesis